MKMLRTLCAAAALAMLPTLPLHAADLLQVYQDALANDAELRAAEANYRAVLEAKPLARSAQLPQISANAEAGSFRSDPDDRDSIDGSRYDLSLNLFQSLFDRRNQIGATQADLQIASAAADLDATRQELIRRVAEAYFDVLLAEETLTFRRAEREAIARQLEQTQRRFEVGLIPITDVKEAQARFDIARADEIAAENELNLANERLAVITNTYYERLAALKPDAMLPTGPDPEDPEQWVSVALEQNQDLIARRLQAEIAREQISRQRAEGLPTLGLAASIGDTGFSGVNGSPGFVDSTDTRIGVRLDVPLYTGGRVSALTREAREQFEAAQEGVVLTERRVIQLTRSSFLSVVSNAARANALRQAVISNQAALESTEAGFEVGTRTQVDVLLALQELFRAERDQAQARYTFLVDRLRLQRAVGSLTEADLQRINQFLE
ncbi:MAG TPA: TolC family outer membrane protein [Thioalkalivibrio sp.]|nr:TolC family outer membrane protein [Thioalkalivibrio sp.]